MVECVLCKDKVVGSIPTISINFFVTNIVPKRNNSMVEYRNHNPFVVGSSPIFVKYKKFMLPDDLSVNIYLIFLGISGIIFNKQSILAALIGIEMMLLGLNFSFLQISPYLDDVTAQIFSLFILTIAACESSIGLAIFIMSYRVKNTINFGNSMFLK